MRYAILVFLLAILLFHCQKQNGIVVTENNGVLQIHNPDRPLQKGVKPLVFKEQFRLGETSEDEHELFNGVVNLNVDKDRNLFILEQGNNRVQLFDRNGKYVKRLGGSGQGPGEYMFPGAIIFNPENEILLFDRRAGKFIFFDSQGDYLKDDGIMDETHKYLVSPQFLDRQKILFVHRGFDRDPENLINVDEIFAFDLVSRKLTELFKLNVKRDVIIGQSGAFISRNKWNTNIMVSPESEIYASNSMDYQIDIYHQSGRKIREIRRDYEPVPLSPEEKQSWKGGARTGDGKTFSPPDYHSAIQGCFFISTDEFWVITSLRQNNRRIIDVYDFNGRFISQLSVNIPISLKRSYQTLLVKILFDAPTKSVYLYQVERDEDGVEQVVCYRATYQPQHKE